jgi:FkbM family methyltransferase
MMMRAFLSRIAKHVLRAVDIDLRRWSRSSEATLLGLARRPIRTIFDIGANAGQFARFIAPRFPQARIYCFEPLRRPFAKLVAWAETQNERVVPFNCALGDAEGWLQMREHVDHDYSSSFLEATELSHSYFPESRHEAMTSVRMLSLDNAAREFNLRLETEILIKMDVQGFEDRVIRGGEETVRQAIACLLEIGLEELYFKQATFSQLLELLGRLGFRYAGNFQQSNAKDGHIRFVDALFFNSIAWQRRTQ